MEPAVQFASTSDEVSIAWAEVGDGPAMLFLTFTPFTHVRDQFTVYREVMEAFSRSFRVITFDARGTGMSERDVTIVSAETHLQDAETVLDAANVGQAIINVDGTSILATSTALRLAVERPDRVTHLVLEAPFQNTRELADTPFGRTNLALAELDWTVYTQTLFRVLLEASSPEMIESYVALAKDWVDPGVGLMYVRGWELVDVGELLPRVRQPTLVTRNEPCFVPSRCCQRIAARIPGAQFRQYSDPTYAQIADLIAEFTGVEKGPVPRSAAVDTTRVDASTAIILFADIANSTALTEDLGDAAFRDKARDLDQALRRAISSNGGTAIDGKLLGDGVLATFGAAREAIACASVCHTAATNVDLALHVGIHAGDIIREEGNVYGGAVNIAARIASEAAAGETLVSATVRDLARTSAGVSFEDRGERELKGVSEPVRVWAVRGD